MKSGVCYIDSSSFKSPLMSLVVSRLGERMGGEQRTFTNGDSLYKYKYPYKRVVPTLFSKLFLCLKIMSPK